ncbi:hypothetical protein K502DRAFT_366789 [Neoconidiobolus thromboides FSU 785]|nr:hypothetical protein K502DRAFT_366789 [Neoconidiobolus thromboides FSU 785]
MEVRKRNRPQKIRSQADAFRIRLDNLEILINNSKSILQCSNKDIKGLTYEYIRWINVILKELNENNIKCIEYETEILAYEYKIKSAILNFHKYYDSNERYFTIDNKIIINIGQKYGTFLEQGREVFVKVIDPYKLWFENLNEYVDLNRKPDLLSCAYLAMLARFTLSRKGSLYKYIYGSCLRKIKQLLPLAYSSPTYSDIVALGLLTYVSLTHFNYAKAKLYYTSAIRMAECLNYNNCDNQFANSSDFEKGTKLWKTLYVNYLILCSTIPDFPLIRFDIQVLSPFIQNSRKVNNFDFKSLVKKGLVGEWLQTTVVKNIGEVNMKIANHVYKLKLKYNEKDYSKIPVEELKLSSDDFSFCLVSILNLNQTYQFDGDREDNHGSNLHYYFYIIQQTNFISLYYPSVLIYPKPIIFPRHEIELLFEISNKISESFLDKDIYLNVVKNTSFIKLTPRGDEIQYHANYELPYLSQIIYSIYFYFNILHFKDNNYLELYNESENICLKMIEKLNLLQTYNSKRVSSQARFALDSIKSALDHYELPSHLATTFNQLSYFN